jgi:tetratricopeptide (TPR) repeat protein
MNGAVLRDRAVFVEHGIPSPLAYVEAMRSSLRVLAVVATFAAASVLGAEQATSEIALRSIAQPGSWPTLVADPVAHAIDVAGPAWPIPAVLRLVLARAALARGDVRLAAADLSALPPSADRLVLFGRLAELDGRQDRADAAYLAAGDLSDVERAVALLVSRDRIPEALLLERALIARLASNPTQVDALAQGWFDLGRLEETQSYHLWHGSPERHAHEVAAARAYARAVALAPLDERYLIAFANQQINLHAYAAATKTLQRAHDVDPTSPEPIAELRAIADSRPHERSRDPR